MLLQCATTFEPGPGMASSETSNGNDRSHGNSLGASAGAGVLEHSLGYHIRRVQLANFRNFARYVRRPKATPTQFTMLVLIDANPGMSQVDLGAILDMDRATTMTVVDKLESRKWVVRKRSTVDRRKHELHLSAQGRTALTAMRKEVDEHESVFAERLTEREKRELLRLLKKLWP